MRRAAYDEIGAAYGRFADEEARGRSALYEMPARGVATDTEVPVRLAELTPSRRQPKLLLAAHRRVAGTAETWAGFEQTVLARPEAVRAVMLERSTQTNEPGRCTVLMPVLARFHPG